ncbi:MAG: hypothetical protein V1903_07510 [Bacteroidota bacterium]
MKKLLPVILICLLFDSCKKEYCWHCEITSKITKEVVKTEDYCGKTEEQIAVIENEITDISVYDKKCVRYLN